MIKFIENFEQIKLGFLAPFITNLNIANFTKMDKSEI